MTPAQDLVATFLDRLEPADRATVPEDLAARLTALCGAARTAHPELADDATLIAGIAGHARGEVVGYLTRCHAGDLALALACASGHPRATAAFQRAYGRVLDSVVRRFVTAEHPADDLRQIVYARLLAGDARRPPKIADYSGQGFLENWLRVTAVRTFLDLGRRKDRARERVGEDDAVMALPGPGDLALDHLKAEYRPVVAAALRDAARALAPGDRMLLRQNLSGGMSIDELAGVLGVHRATVARRISRARDALLDRVRAALGERLRMTSDEVDSVIGLVASRLEITAQDLFATGPAA